MPRVTCGKCSRELEFSGERPSFCAYCGQSLNAQRPEPTESASFHPMTVERIRSTAGRGDETIDYVPGPGSVDPRRMPERVKGYRLIRQLGRGGMGTVYEAEDSRHGRRVALKIIAPGYIDSDSAVERFRQEGRLASSLTHPRCVFVLEADEAEDGRPFIAMELMTGDTLQDLVDKNGPLAIGDAVGKILDVIEGLAEAHRLGLIHRDVKPSNSFLDGDGRVKVGDFGLSKSQVGARNQLTRTGSFLGTPLYASPEQIKVEPLDERTDVYSTAATLFFLLTGKAPFERGDASATMARIVTEPPPSAREKRPEVPAGLDRAIRKALETDRDRRTRDLAAFREAIRPYAPGQFAPARVSVRAGASLFDALPAMTTLFGLNAFDARPRTAIVVSHLVMFAYFTLGDGIWGGTLGKRLLRLRVTDTAGHEAPGLRRATIRTLVFLALADTPITLLVDLEQPWERWPVAFGLGGLAVVTLGFAVLVAPMRRANGDRGMHELASRTRVVALPRDERRRSAGARRTLGRDRGSVTRPIGVLQSVGPYKVRGAVKWEPNRRVVAGEDPTLGREAWIVIRPKGSPAPEPARRELTRSTRPRWLNGGDQQEGRWDAYIAPAGCPIADLAGLDGLTWHDARPILEDLADELAAACAEGTLPLGLSPEQVWVQPDGRAILVDPLGSADSSADPPGQADDARALILVQRVAALALEGGRRRLDDHSAAIKSPVPLHVSALLGRLVGGQNAYATMAEFRDEIQATRELPTEVTVGQRATRLGILTLFVAAGLIATFVLVYLMLTGTLDPFLDFEEALGPTALAVRKFRMARLVGSAIPATWIVWDFLTRGGFSMSLAGLGLIGWDGRRAARWRCAWRSLMVWAPPFVLLIASTWLQLRVPTLGWLPWVPFWTAAVLLPAYVASALAMPSRGPHDWLSGLRVVTH